MSKSASPAMIAPITAQAGRRTGATLATQPAGPKHWPSSPAATFEWPLSFVTPCSAFPSVAASSSAISFSHADNFARASAASMSGRVRFGASLGMSSDRPRKIFPLLPVSWSAPRPAGQDKVNVRFVSDSSPIMSGLFAGRSCRPLCQPAAANQILPARPSLAEPAGR